MAQKFPSKVLYAILGLNYKTLAATSVLLLAGAVGAAEGRPAPVDVSDRRQVVEDIALGAASGLLGVGSMLAGVLAICASGKRPTSQPE